jgi:hypothetical protein
VAQDYTKQIEEQYEQSLAAKKAQLKAAFNQNTTAYKKKLSEAAAQYGRLKNEAYVNNALAERARRENIANMGVSGAGGTSQTLQQRNTAALLGALGDASRQEQDYTDNVNFALANLAAQYGADVTSLEASNTAERNEAMIKQSRWQADYDMDWRKMLHEEQQDAFSQAYSLYLKRLITAAQFQAMTGVALRR